MTLKGKPNHFNVKLLSGYGISVRLKENMMKKQRSLIIFEEPIKSENTKQVYHYLLEKFKC